MSNLTRLDSEIKKAEKEFRISKRKSVIAKTGCATLAVLLHLLPTVIGLSIFGKCLYVIKEKKVTDNYAEEISLDTDGYKRVKYIYPSEKKDNYLRVYKDIIEYRNQYAAKYDIYKGNKVNLDSYEMVVNGASVENVLGTPDSYSMDYFDDKVEKGDIEAVIYRDSDKTFERNLRKDDKEYQIYEAVALGDGGVMVGVSILTIPIISKVKNGLEWKLNVPELELNSTLKYGKVLELKRKRKREFEKVDNGYLFSKK